MSLISQWINLLRFTSRLFFWSVGEWTVYMRFVCRFVYFFFFWRCTQSTNKLRVNHMALILVFVAAFPNIWIDLPTPKLNYKKRHPYFIFINNSGSTLIFDGFEMCVARAPTHQPTHSQNTSHFLCECVSNIQSRQMIMIWRVSDASWRWVLKLWCVHFNGYSCQIVLVLWRSSRVSSILFAFQTN